MWLSKQACKAHRRFDKWFNKPGGLLTQGSCNPGNIMVLATEETLFIQLYIRKM